MMPSIKFGGREAEGFMERLVLWFVFIVLTSFGLVSAPILLIVHFLLRACGRKGLIFRDENGNLHVNLFFVEIEKTKNDEGGKR
jgi:hypothetical protein